MRFTFALFVLTAAASTVYAGIMARDGEEKIPPCVQKCLEASVSATSCGLKDTKCLCTDEKFIHTVGSCVKASCSPSDIEAAEQGFNEVCGPFLKDGATTATASTSSKY